MLSRASSTTEVEDGFNELCCHPGYVDEDLVSSYTARAARPSSRRSAIRSVAALLSERGIRLATFREVPQPMTRVLIATVRLLEFMEGAGHFWAYMQYAQALRRLGCEVLPARQLHLVRRAARRAPRA